MPIPTTCDPGHYGTYTVSVKDYGALGDGVTDDTTAIKNAMSAVNSNNGGIVYFPAGTYITGNQTLYANMSLLGSGIGATTLRLKAGANTDLLSAQTSSINLSAALYTGIVGTLYNFSVQNMTLDGNKANQTSGTSYPLRFYGYNFTIRDIEVLNGYTGGVLTDWNGSSEIASPSDDMESLIENSKIHDCNGIGLQMGGPHDSRLMNVISFLPTSHCFHLAPNCLGTLALNCHGYAAPNTTGICTWLVESSGNQFTNCVVEGSYHTNLVILGNNNSWCGGYIYGASGSATEIGLQLGQIAGQTPFPGQILQAAGVTTASNAGGGMIQTVVNGCPGGAINFVNEANNNITASVYQTTGTAIIGTPSTSDNYNILVNGLTPDGTLGKGGGVQISANSAPSLSLVSASGLVYQVDRYGNIYLNGGFNSSSGMYFTASTTAAALATGGTIGLQGLSNIAVAPTVDVTGVILQAGYSGQFCVVVNASAFNITFAASATSHVASGTSSKIAPMSACTFFYDGTNSLWHPCAYTALPTQSATAVALASGGTVAITDLNTSRVAPTAAVTSVIFSTGQYPGQLLTVINESTFPITFAASGTSLNAEGVTDTLPGLTARMYVWDSGTSLWYPLSEVPVQSATAVAVATSGTIATVGLDTSRVAPTAAVTGVILASGTFAGQSVTVINESAFSVTFAASGTSHVADGTSDVIAATNARTFRWDTGTSLWYPCK